MNYERGLGLAELGKLGFRGNSLRNLFLRKWYEGWGTLVKRFCKVSYIIEGNSKGEWWDTELLNSLVYAIFDGPLIIWMNDWMNDWMNEWIISLNQLVNKSVDECFYELINKCSNLLSE